MIYYILRNDPSLTILKHEDGLLHIPASAIIAETREDIEKARRNLMRARDAVKGEWKTATLTDLRNSYAYHIGELSRHGENSIDKATISRLRKVIEKEMKRREKQ